MLQSFPNFAMRLKSMQPHNTKIGILGGGQLGKMLAQEATRMDLDIHFMDPSPNAPVSVVCSSFCCGDFNDFDQVIAFGKDKNVVSIEIEHVNVLALEHLESLGVLVFPQTSILRRIQDKGLQKVFYQEHNIPTAPFKLFKDAAEVLNAVDKGVIHIPFVQKLRTGGYDGKGVLVVRNTLQLKDLMDGPCIIESLAPIQKEIGVIAVRNVSGECKVYSPVSMDFHPEANLVEDVLCPAEIPYAIQQQAINLAKSLANALGIVGLLAVEMFYNIDGSLWVNEIAPRPHNSGHLTLNNGSINQFENHLRAILDLPLGDTLNLKPSLMMNLLGEEGASGAVKYLGMRKLFELPGIHLYLYGKSETRPFRKMGHINITAESVEACRNIARSVRQIIKITT